MRKYNPNRVPLVMNYNKTLSNVKDPVTIFWNVANVGSTFDHNFREVTRKELKKNANTNWKKYIAGNKI